MIEDLVTWVGGSREVATGAMVGATSALACIGTGVVSYWRGDKGALRRAGLMLATALTAVAAATVTVCEMGRGRWSVLAIGIAGSLAGMVRGIPLLRGPYIGSGACLFFGLTFGGLVSSGLDRVPDPQYRGIVTMVLLSVGMVWVVLLSWTQRKQYRKGVWENETRYLRGIAGLAVHKAMLDKLDGADDPRPVPREELRRAALELTRRHLHPDVMAGMGPRLRLEPDQVDDLVAHQVDCAVLEYAQHTRWVCADPAMRAGELE